MVVGAFEWVVFRGIVASPLCCFFSFVTDMANIWATSTPLYIDTIQIMSNVLRLLLLPLHEKKRKQQVLKRTARSAIFIHSESSCCLRSGTMNLEHNFFSSNTITSFFSLLCFVWIYALHDFRQVSLMCFDFRTVWVGWLPKFGGCSSKSLSIFLFPIFAKQICT